MSDPVEEVHRAFRADDAARVRALLRGHPELKRMIDEPLGSFGEPAIVCARSREMLDVLLEAGADIDARSRWWAGGFGLLHLAPPELALHAIARGATVDAHAAARLGLLDRLREIIAADPSAVHARGGDGQTPLHFAGSVEAADILLDHGADIEARDVDHESTPAQYMARDRQPVLRRLIERGCRTDLLLAAALGDVELARRHLDADPDSIRLRVSDEHFPMIGGKAGGGKPGGTIYQWTLGWHVSAHQVARDFGHPEVLRLLLERSPVEVRWVAACWMGDAGEARAILAREPDVAARLHASERRSLAHAARNDDLAAASLFLEGGMPLDATGQHGGTPLHWAAWHGNAELVRRLLERRPPLEITDADFQATPLGWAIHGSENGWHPERGDHAAAARMLLDAGAKPPVRAGGSPGVREALRGRGAAD